MGVSEKQKRKERSEDSKDSKVPSIQIEDARKKMQGAERQGERNTGVKAR